jgi:hypothetical protein
VIAATPSPDKTPRKTPRTKPSISTTEGKAKGDLQNPRKNALRYNSPAKKNTPSPTSRWREAYIAYYWSCVDVWRKREAYITLCRHANKRPVYPQWDCFLFEDYAQRLRAAKTLRKRP